jgi:hypothetical protein
LQANSANSTVIDHGETVNFDVGSTTVNSTSVDAGLSVSRTNNSIYYSVKLGDGLRFDNNGNVAIKECAAGQILKVNTSHNWDCATDADTRVDDYVVYQSHSSTYNYRVWNNGYQELSATITQQVPNAYTSNYVSGDPNAGWWLFPGSSQYDSSGNAVGVGFPSYWTNPAYMGVLDYSSTVGSGVFRGFVSTPVVQCSLQESFLELTIIEDVSTTKASCWAGNNGAGVSGAMNIRYHFTVTGFWK